MRSKFMLPMLALIVMLCLPALGMARQIHDFDCGNCHKPGSSLSTVGNILCLDCHDGNHFGTTYPLLKTGPGNTGPIGNATFVTGDASDAMGSVTAQGGSPGDENSHNWAAADKNPAAGATAPSNRRFYGRQNYSGATVNCGRCHDPHGYDTNPKLLKLGTGTEAAMCNDCHVDWASDTAPSEGGSAPTNVHPMVTDYATIAAAKSTEYNSVVDLNATAGEVTLNGSGGIDCLSCHGVHFTDSDSSTTDGVGQSLNPGDGKVLKANGPNFDAAAVAGVSLCQACHKYKDHGTGRSNPIGCLVCHGAHLEDVGGSMNNYMLRSSITTYLPNGGAAGTVNGLTLNITDTPVQKTRLWNYCFDCHVEASAAITHNASWNCSDCHSHSDTDGSWTAAGGCNTCHGYPPSENAVADGINAGYAAGYNTSGHFKNEVNTQHVAHAGGGSDYSFRCSTCHKNNNHIMGDFADAILAPYDPLIDGDGALTGGSEPNYVALSGTCSNIYCHSNGNPRSNGSLTVNDPGVWEGGAAITTCDACHGNDSTDMATRNNSVVHLNHLDAGYGCQVCHADTATSASALTATADDANGVHVNGTADVAIDGASIGLDLSGYSYGITDGTCSVYCHSNGTTFSAPDWDQPVTGKCGSCHQADSDDTGTALSAPHSIHLFDAGGPQLYVDAFNYGCDNCHTHAGSGGDHIDASINLVANACDACHGSDGSSTSGDDQIPVWTDDTTVSCATCHSGSVIATINVAAPAKSYFATTGHGKTGVTQNCSDCHDIAADSNHLDGSLGNTDRLRTDLGATYNASSSKTYCSVCHDGGSGDEDNHYANSNTTDQATDTSTDGDNCVICHDPHGQVDKNTDDLDAMLRATIGGRAVTGFSNKTDPTKYYNTVDTGEGVCQTCHDPNEVNNFNRTTANISHGGGGLCVSCHTHTITPAFKASCNGCHGDATTGQYWPDGDGDTQVPAVNDGAGRHEEHITVLAQSEYSQTVVQLLADADTDTKQKALCAFCHDNPGADGDHATGVDAETTFHPAWNVALADTDSAYVGGSCNSIACHNNKDTGTGTYGWNDAATSVCVMCHNDITTGIATGQTHSAHTGASSTYGVSITCASCHDAATDWAGNAKPASNHIDGTFDMGGTVSLTYTGTFGTSFGSCGINACHENGLGGASVEQAGDGYTWGTAETSACGICHVATPTMYDHAIHLSGAGSSYGPKLINDCGACHNANANNTSMSGKTTHMNGTLTFTDGGAPYEIANGDIDNGTNTIDTCDACHGGETAANVAKGYWFTADRVTCESCHGATPAIIGGVTAPSRAGSAYTSWGHGRTTGNAPNQGCAACHAESSAHISGALGQDRLDNSPNNNYDYAVAGERNDFCNDCHTTVGAMNAHFADSNTTGGGSTDGLYCVTCHDPHGQAGFDAMVDSSVGGTTVGAGTRTVAGFTDRTDRDTYRNASFTGVCQTCHASVEVDFFDQDTEDANATHNPGSNCISCHTHTTNPAFKASCNGCHGDATTGQYWPDGDGDTQVPAVNDGAGRHAEHITVLAQSEYSQTVVQLLADADTDTKQKALCAFCHDSPGADGDHATGTDAETTFHPLWNVGAADASAAYAAGSCNSIACHNNKSTGTGTGTYGWNDDLTTACIMCHNDVTTGGTVTGKSHVDHMGAFSNYGVVIACTDCHESGTAWGTPGTKPGSGHLDGTFSVDKSGEYPHFSYSGNWAQLGAGNQATCGTNDCHNNGQMGTPYNAGNASYEWGDTVGFGCLVCHNWGLEQPSTNAHAAHFAADDNNIKAGNMSCNSCHNSSGMTVLHLNQTINLHASMDYRDGADSDIVTLGDNKYGSCNTTTCHNNGSGVAVTTPAWDRTPASADNCTICHAAVPATGTHSTHVKNTYVPSDYTNTTGSTTLTDYIFACSDCHGSTLTNHINGTKSLDSGLGWSSSTCTTSYCHSDGNGSYTASPGWNGGNFPADKCAGCHGNSPTTNAHQAHEVGIHFDTLYNGTSGLLATGSTEPSAHGARWGDNTTGTSTVISCHICHFDTVNVWYNDQNDKCDDCHGNTAPAKGDADIADKRKHVDGNKDVVFQAIKVASKAQLRNDITTVPEVDANWERIKPDGVWAAIVGLFYKENDSFDRAKTALDTATMYNSGAKTCSNISCHNGIEATWAAPAGDCSACHTTVSQ